MDQGMLMRFAQSFAGRADVDVTVYANDGDAFYPSDIDAVAVAEDASGLMLFLTGGRVEYLTAEWVDRISVRPDDPDDDAPSLAEFNEKLRAEQAQNAVPLDVRGLLRRRPGREFFQPGPMPEVQGNDPFEEVPEVPVDGGSAGGGKYTLGPDGSIERDAPPEPKQAPWRVGRVEEPEDDQTMFTVGIDYMAKVDGADKHYSKIEVYGGKASEAEMLAAIVTNFLNDDYRQRDRRSKGIVGEPEGRVWDCKIGFANGMTLPEAADAPMRQAVEKAFHDLTGRYPDFCFSGWGANLTMGERAAAQLD